MEDIKRGSHFFQRGRIRGRLYSHREIRAEQKQARAPELPRGKAFAKKEGGESERSGRADASMGECIEGADWWREIESLYVNAVR